MIGGVNWETHANATIRPEIRYDAFNGVVAAAGLPFNDGRFEQPVLRRRRLHPPTY